MKKIIAVIISVSLLLPALTGFAATDFNGHWAAFYISYLKSEGIVSGDANGNMRPVFVEDGLHLTAEGYVEMAKYLGDQILACLN